MIEAKFVQISTGEESKNWLIPVKVTSSQWEHIVYLTQSQVAAILGDELTSTGVKRLVQEKLNGWDKQLDFFKG